MSHYRKDVGQWGEDIACRYLSDLGYKIIQRNYYTRYGEIDIVSRFGEQTVFIEVKTRTTQSYGLPEESITEKKQQNLINAALIYMSSHAENRDAWQIDVITVEGQYLSTEPMITHFQNAVGQ